VKPQPGGTVLDLATGTGDAARLAHETLGSDCLVIGVDLSLPMLRVARQKAGSAQLVLAAADAMRLPLADQCIQCAICLFGLMFFPRPVDALRELRRVLTTGGRAAFTTWARPERAPFAGIMAEALAAALPEHAIDVLKPFSLSDPDVVGGYMKAAGFHEVQVKPLSRHGLFASVDDYLEPYERGGGRLGQFYLELDEEARKRVKAQVGARLRSSSPAGPITVQIDALLVSGIA
jgi:SAM-dependent methyltransferase